MTRAVMRYATWTLAPDQTPGASPPLHELECTTCLESSGATEDADTPQQWALEHSGRQPSHTGFRALHTSFWRTRLVNEPAPTRPDGGTT